MLKDNLTNYFLLPEPAVEWLCALFDSIQTLDDVADGDTVDRANLDKLIYDSLVGMSSNPFFQANHSQLLPVMSCAILKWQASDAAEKSGKANAMSFGWRAGFYDLVLLSVAICHGHQVATKHAHEVMGLYGEKFEDYLREFDHA